MFVLTFLLNGGLYHRISFLCLFSLLQFACRSRFILEGVLITAPVLSSTGLRLDQMRLSRMRSAKGVC